MSNQPLQLLVFSGKRLAPFDSRRYRPDRFAVAALPAMHLVGLVDAGAAGRPADRPAAAGASNAPCYGCWACSR